MLKIRPSSERGHFQNDWLKSWHSFSFGQYMDPSHMQHRALRVINQDIIAPGGGFPSHPHQDMEIITYIIRGRLAHEDSTGTVQEIGPGEIQRMTAGTGIVHSEFNPSEQEETELLQIWLRPKERGLPPSYEQKHYNQPVSPQAETLLVSTDGHDGSVLIHQDASMYKGVLSKGQSVTHSGLGARHGWIQLINGALQVNGLALEPGDGLAVSEEPSLGLVAFADTEYLRFELD